MAECPTCGVAVHVYRDEVTALTARLREVAAERDQWRDRAALVEQQGRETAVDRDILQRMHHGQAEYLRADAIKIQTLEARLADAQFTALNDAANALEGRLGTDGAPTDLWEFRRWLRDRADEVRAAARGEAL